MTKVLIVEDNPMNMELMLVMLKTNGFEAYSAFDGKEAIENMEKENFDIILMDIELPGINGVEVARTIKEKYKNIPIIAVTSFAMRGDKERFIASGFDDYVSKPVDISSFLIKLNKYKKN
ncbi:MAG: response regulator [Candidatus Methanoperedens sp.]|nr:response regulator [Candidatus Methanoperedens sp.]